MGVGVERSFSSVHVISDLQLNCTGIARGSRGSAGILFSCYISQFEENRFAGMAIRYYARFVARSDFLLRLTLRL